VAKDRVVFVQPDYAALADGGDPPARGVLRTDDRAGVAASVRHLVERGYRSITFVGPGENASGVLRRSAANVVFAELGLGTMRFIDAGLDGWRDASRIAEQVASNPPEAILCYDDKLALALLDALRSTQLDVPGDVALAGFDGIPAARQTRPRLTTIDVPSVDMGRRAVEMLVAALRDGTMPQSSVSPVELVIGESTPQRAAPSRSGPGRSREMVAARGGIDA
jgi:LacI family transcriptional regulator